MVGGGESSLVFTKDSDRGVEGGPGKNLSNIGSSHIDTTVGHGNTKIVVPISAVKAKA